MVITGASSGLGRATALEFARRGARVVLAARGEEALEEAAARCRALGTEAVAVPTDVTDEEAVRRLAERALELTGRIDVWVNNAGVTSFAPLLEGPFDIHRRVIETNVYGPIFGARAVLPIFQRQRAGTMINVGSVLGKVGQPYVPSYVISKFALQGMTETLRKALSEEPDIHVCTLLPYAIDTPHFEEGANLTGYDARAMPPMQPPEKVARALVALAERPRRERYVPRVMGFGVLLHALFPDFGDRVVLQLTREWHFGHKRMPASRGNLYRPSDGPGTTRGRRPQRITLPRMLAWGAVQVARSLVRSPSKPTDLRPHASP